MEYFSHVLLCYWSTYATAGTFTLSGLSQMKWSEIQLAKHCSMPLTTTNCSLCSDVVEQRYKGESIRKELICCDKKKKNETIFSVFHVCLDLSWSWPMQSHVPFIQTTILKWLYLRNCAFLEAFLLQLTHGSKIGLWKSLSECVRSQMHRGKVSSLLVRAWVEADPIFPMRPCQLYNPCPSSSSSSPCPSSCSTWHLWTPLHSLIMLRKLPCLH